MSPLNAGAWVPTPSALRRPLTPCGSFGVAELDRARPLGRRRGLPLAARARFVGRLVRLLVVAAPEQDAQQQQSDDEQQSRQRDGAQGLISSGPDRAGHRGDRLGARRRPTRRGGRPPRAGRRRRRWPPRPRAGAAAGPGEHERVLALEEPVAADAAGAAALGRVLRERRHLDGTGLGARQRGAGAGDRDDHGRVVRVERAERDHRARPDASRTPAMPPPERPCGRTWPAPKCSSCASEVTKQSSSSPVRELDRADHLVAVGERDHLPLVAVAEHLGADPLDHPVAGAERLARRCRSPARSARAPAPRPRATGTR